MPSSSEIMFEIREDEMDNGYTARALGYPIFTQGDNLDELRFNIRGAVECYFDKPEEAPYSP